MSIAPIIPLDTLEAAEERAKHDEWGQVMISLRPVGRERYRLIAVELDADYTYILNVSHKKGVPEKSRITRREALRLIHGCGPLCSDHGDPRDTSLGVQP